jgi:hypothetical protein
MFCHFQSTRQNGRAQVSLPPSMEGEGAPVCPLPCPPAPSSLMPLLEELRGHEVTLQVGGAFLSGKLVCLKPLILVGRDGSAIAVAPERIESVQF